MSRSEQPLAPVAAYQPPAWIYYGLLGLAIALVAAAVGVSLRNTIELRASVDSVAHTHEVLRALSETEVGLAEAEATRRGYLILGDRVQLAQIQDADARMHAGVRGVATLTADNPAQHKAALLLRTDADSRSRIDREIVAAYERDGSRAGMLRGEALGGPAVSRSMSRLINTMKAEELRQLDARQSRMQQQLDQTRSTIIIAGGLGLVAGLLGLAMLSRSSQAWKQQLVAELESRRARAQSEEKSTFLANMSHEIRTPMNAIFGFSQLLGELVTGERERQYVRSISSAGRSLLALINDILDLSKIEAGKVEIALAPTDPRELVDSVLGMFTQLAADKRLSVRADISVRVPASLRLDTARTRQVLTNLVGNALKYTDAGGVLLRAWCVPRAGAGEALDLHLAIEDSGIGIPTAQLERIFEPFVQAEPSIQGRREGTGLGLSITRSLVGLMGGEIRVASQPGQGSTFEVVLPTYAERGPAPAAVAVAQAPRPNRLPPLRILIVDDVALNRQLIAAIFAGSHHTLYEAANGVDAVASVRSERPDVVLMDIRMPQLDGFAACARIRADHSLDGVRLIAVTASSLRDEERGLRNTFDGYVRKPFTRDEMLLEIARVMDIDLAAPVATAAVAMAADAVPLPIAALSADAARSLLAELSRARWLELTQSLAMRDIGAFADEVGALARAADLHAIEAWSQRLRNAVVMFDVAAVESNLAQYPAHLRESGVAAADAGASA